MTDAWGTYLQQQANPQPVQKQTTGNPFLDLLLGRTSGGGGGAGPGQVPRPNGQGLYTPGINMAGAGPPTPINYAAIRNMLNSGVMQTGKVPPMPTPAPAAAPPPAAPPQASSFENVLSSLFGGLLG